MQAGTQVNETLRSLNQRGQDIGCECVDGKNMRQAVFGRDAPRFLVSDARIVDHRIEGAARIDLFGHFPRLSDACQIADHNCLGSGNRGKRFASALLIASV